MFDPIARDEVSAIPMNTLVAARIQRFGVCEFGQNSCSS